MRLGAKIFLAMMLAGILNASAQQSDAQVAAQSNGQTGDTATQALQKKPWTVTAALREEYDDNIYTSNVDRKASFKTEVQPSLLLNYPIDQTLLSFRYTYDATYFYDRPGNKIDSSHEFVGRINHSFSSRFNLDARERFRYAQEPELFDSATTLQRAGDYINNTASVQATLQWTPKFGTITGYTNDYYDYMDPDYATIENRDVNTVTQDFRYLVSPTVTFVANGIFDDVSYDSIARSYDDYTGDVGADWTVTPQFVVGGRFGGTKTALEDGESYSSPYAQVTGNWVLGARSSLTASYTHSVSQTDLANAYAQESDTFTLGFKYQVTARLAARLEGIYTHGEYDGQLLFGGPQDNFTEDVAALDANISYKYNEYLSFEGGYNYSTVVSEIALREYDRDRIYIGVRGTY